MRAEGRIKAVTSWLSFFKSPPRPLEEESLSRDKQSGRKPQRNESKFSCQGSDSLAGPGGGDQWEGRR